MAMRRTVLLTALFALAIGCARPDWVGSTLATVDVTGEWQGSYTSGTSGGSIAMKLEQRGAKVTGTCQVSHPSGASGAVAGTVTGDKLRFDSASFLTGELTVGVDEMAGILNRASAAPGGIPGSRLSVLLRRQ